MGRRELIGEAPVVAVGAATLSICTMPLILLGTLAVSIRADLGFGESTLGALASSLTVTAALTSGVAGKLCDVLGGMRALRAAVCGAATAMIGMAAVSRSWVTLLPFIALAGAAMALAQPATDAWLSAQVAQARQGSAFAVKQAVGGPGIGLLAGLAVPATQATYGWRGAFVIGSLLALLTVVALRPRGPTLRRPVVEAGPFGSLGFGPLITLTIAGALATVPQAGFVTFAVSTAVDSGLSQGAAGFLFAIACAAGLGTRLTLGRLVDSRGLSNLRSIAWLLMVSSAGFACLAVGQRWSAIIAIPVLAATAWGWHGLFFLAVARTNTDLPGRASGIVSSGVFIGAVAGPSLTGLVAESSFSVAWLVAGVWSLLSAVAFLRARTVVVRSRGRLSMPSEGTRAGSSGISRALGR